MVLQDDTTRSDVGPILGALAALGLAIAFVALQRSKPAAKRTRSGTSGRPSRPTCAITWPAQIRPSRLSGASATRYRGGPEGALFESLHEQFREDRGVVEVMLAELGYTSRSAKRVAGRATGSALRVLAGGAPGDPVRRPARSLRSPSACRASAVCGEAAQALVALPHPPGRRSFVELEADAVRQWEHDRGASAVTGTRTFGVSMPPSSERTEAPDQPQSDQLERLMTPVSSALRQDLTRTIVDLACCRGRSHCRALGWDSSPGLGLMDSSTDHSASASGFSLIGLLLARGTRETPATRA